jgi:hypothetical protein
MLKFCLDSRVEAKYRKKADELYIEYRDLKSAERFFTPEYENTIIIIDTPAQLTPDEYNLLKRWAGVTDNIRLALHSYSQIIANNDISDFFKWYIMSPCNSFMEARALQDAGAEYIVLGETLFFNITRLKNCGIKKVRIMANQAIHSTVPRNNGICGPWVRPEDVALYDQFQETVIEFPGCLPSKEQALYRIYAEQHQWPGPVSYIVDNFNHDCENRMLPTEFTERRLDCRQRCNSCHICPNLVRIANNLINKEEDIQLFL